MFLVYDLLHKQYKVVSSFIVHLGYGQSSCVTGVWLPFNTAMNILDCHKIFYKSVATIWTLQINNKNDRGFTRSNVTADILQHLYQPFALIFNDSGIILLRNSNSDTFILVKWIFHENSSRSTYVFQVQSRVKWSEVIMVFSNNFFSWMIEKKTEEIVKPSLSEMTNFVILRSVQVGFKPMAYAMKSTV